MSKVLIVDDEDAYRDALTEIFADDGYDVVSAGDGRGAVAIGESFEPDLLVVDWMLEDDLDGFDVANALRASRPDLRTILITGYPTPALEAKAIGSGIAAILYKPFGPADLRAAVQRASAA